MVASLDEAIMVRMIKFPRRSVLGTGIRTRGNTLLVRQDENATRLDFLERWYTPLSHRDPALVIECNSGRVCVGPYQL